VAIFKDIYNSSLTQLRKKGKRTVEMNGEWTGRQGFSGWHCTSIRKFI